MKFGNRHKALERAAKKGDYRKIALLLKSGPRIETRSLANALYYAAENGHLGATQILFNYIKKDLDEEGEYIWNIITNATRNGHLDVVEYLLLNFYDDPYDDPDDFLNPVIYHASYEGHRHIIERMLQLGGTIEPDHIRNALYNGHEDLAVFLHQVLEAGGYRQWRQLIQDQEGAQLVEDYFQRFVPHHGMLSRYLGLSTPDNNSLREIYPILNSDDDDY